MKLVKEYKLYEKVDTILVCEIALQAQFGSLNVNPPGARFVLYSMMQPYFVWYFGLRGTQLGPSPTHPALPFSWVIISVYTM